MKKGRERAMHSSGGNSTCKGPGAEGRTRRPVWLEQREEDIVGGGEVRGRDWGGGRGQNM